MRSSSSVIGVFGGAFDPPHAAHVLVPALVLSLTEVQQVVVVPTYEHPFGKRMAPFADRLNMCRAAFRVYDRRVIVSPIEQRIATLGAPNYSIRTLDAVADAHPHCRIRLIVGADVWSQRERWFAFDQVERRYAPILIGRQGFPTPEGATALPDLPNVNSSDLRAQISAGRNPVGELPRSVLSLIRSHSLYAEDSAS